MRLLRILFFFILVIPAETVTAQPYEHALGVRAGYSSGISYKGFFRYSMNAVGLDACYNRFGLNISLMYQFHLEPFRSDRWLVYAGGGVFGGDRERVFSTGVVAVAGIEYVLRDLPLTFGLDWKPLLTVYRTLEPDMADLGLSIRYRFSL